MTNVAQFPRERSWLAKRPDPHAWANRFWVDRPSSAQVRAFRAGLMMPRAASQEQINFKLAAHRDHVAAFYRGRALHSRLRRGYLDAANPRPWVGVRWQPGRPLSQRLWRLLQPLGALLWPTTPTSR